MNHREPKTAKIILLGGTDTGTGSYSDRRYSDKCYSDKRYSDSSYSDSSYSDKWYIPTNVTLCAQLQAYCSVTKMCHYME